ncbi:MAG TPA: PhzF family phenazine biosynthesis protein [Terriglobales bacterium]|nr:PhzF family phenazine biosynthesis protein [Terriglobales bacterium]
MRRFPYVVLDVFTNQPMQGNPLAVFSEARGLSDAEMQSIAKETNLSETTFILPRDAAAERERGVRVRIFTPTEELPFAGHPTLGTATYLRSAAQLPSNQVDLELNIGKIPVTFEERGKDAPFGEMCQSDPEFGQTHELNAVAQMAGLEPADLRDDVPIQTVSTGVAFAIVPVKTLRAMHSLTNVFSWQTALRYLNRTDAKFAYFICTETDEPGPGGPQANIHARMFFYNGEDPATGSAAGCAAAWMARYKVAKSGERLLIEQGVEMKRRSQLYVRADVANDKIVNVRVGGQAVIIARGEFELP